MEQYLNVMKNHYADFDGRARRQEFWMYYLFFGIAFIAASVIGALVSPTVYAVLMGLTILVHIIPTLAVIVRRLHDTDKSGWWLLIGVIPLAGIVLFIFYCIEGTPGPNQFGPDPKGRGGNVQGAADVLDSDLV